MPDPRPLPSTSINDPTFEEAASAINQSLSTRRVLIIVGNCHVEYVGRASSSLDWGERILMIKRDGSVLLHRPTGYEPVNWQPSKCIFRIEPRRENLLIVASRSQHNETLTLLFDRIISVSFYDLLDQAEFNLYVSELQMKKTILTRPDLVEKGFRPITSEKNLGEAGFTDVIGEDGIGNLVIVEIKRNPAGKESVIQLNRYVNSIRKDLNRGIRGIIVAPELRKGTQSFLAVMNLEFKALSLQRCAEILAERETRKISEFLRK